MFEIAKPEQKDKVERDVQKKQEKTGISANLTGIPDNMKTRFENLSGFSFDDVRVHYNSDKPAQLQALAYTQGNQVHVAPGQEKHLGHELGHVVQQKGGFIRPNTQLKVVKINDEQSRENDADSIASRAMTFSPEQPIQLQRVGGVANSQTNNVTQLERVPNPTLNPYKKNALDWLNGILPELKIRSINMGMAGTIIFNKPGNALGAFGGALPPANIQTEIHGHFNQETKRVTGVHIKCTDSDTGDYDFLAETTTIPDGLNERLHNAGFKESGRLDLWPLANSQEAVTARSIKERMDAFRKAQLDARDKRNTAGGKTVEATKFKQQKLRGKGRPR